MFAVNCVTLSGDCIVHLSELKSTCVQRLVTHPDFVQLRDLTCCFWPPLILRLSFSGFTIRFLTYSMIGRRPMLLLHCGRACMRVACAQYASQSSYISALVFLLTQLSMCLQFAVFTSLLI